MLLPHRSQGRLNSRPGCYAIVDNNSNAPFQRSARAAFEVKTAAALDLGQFLLADVPELLFRDIEERDDIVVAHNVRGRAVDHRSHRQLRLRGQAELAHREKSERRSERFCNLSRDRDAAPEES